MLSDSLPPTPTLIWNETLNQLSLQMARQTFDSWLKDTYVITTTTNNGNWGISVKSNYAKEWLENRLLELILKSLKRVAADKEFSLAEDFSLEFVFIEDQQPSNEKDDPLSHQPEPLPISSPQLKPKPIIFYKAKQKMGRWLPEHQYDRLFVAPYLGEQTFGTYRYLLHHWTKSLRKKDMGLLDVNQFGNHCWTPPFKISYRKITLAIGKSNSKIVPGGEYECHNSQDQIRVDQRLADCQECHDPCDWRPESSGGRCYYWREGLLHKLHREHLLAIEVSATRRAQIQIWRTVPLLTPWQVTQMSDYLQDKHERWLEKHCEDHFDITTEQWSQITSQYMISTMEDFDTKKLFGTPPENPFLLKAND